MPDHSRALVIGEAIVDEVTHDDGTVVRLVGGSPANVALGLARLDVSTSLLTCIARDSDGAAIVERLAESGASVAEGSFCASMTPVAHVTLAADGQPSYAFEIEWELPPFVPPAEPVDLIHLGSYSAFLEPGADVVASAARWAAGNGVALSFDPNVRAQLLGDRDAARERFAELCRLATVVKLSDEDLAWLFPGTSEQEVVARLHDFGVSLVAVTRGASGSLVANRRGAVEVAAVAVDAVVDTIGAGDSYMAALIRSVIEADGELSDLDADAMLRIGNSCAAAAAITVSRPGAHPPTTLELLSTGAG